MNIETKKILLTTICLYSLLSTTSHILAESSTTAPFKFIYASTIGATGYTISNPGYYVLVEDVAFSPNANDLSAITTATDHVTINLNDHSIYQYDISKTGVFGIKINAGLHDVTIQNGALSCFTGYGIYVINNCYKINLENVKISDATCTSAIRFVGTSGNEIHDCVIENCKVNEITCGTYCSSFDYCNDIKIINSNFNNNTTTNTPTNYIIYIGCCNNCSFTHCQMNKNNSVTTNFYIVYLANSDSCLFDNCILSKNSVTGQKVNCFYLASSNANIIKNCTMDSNSTSRTGGSVGFSGIYINSGSGNIIDSCSITNNTTITDSTSAGVWALVITDATSRNDIVRNCSIMSNKAHDTSDTDARFFGFDINNGSHHYVENCQAIDNEVTTTSDIAYGFRNLATASVIKNCRSFGNTTHGFYNDVTDAIFIGCSAGYNGAAGVGNYGGAHPPESEDVTKLGDNGTVMNKYGNANINTP